MTASGPGVGVGGIGVCIGDGDALGAPEAPGDADAPADAAGAGGDDAAGLPLATGNGPPDARADGEPPGAEAEGEPPGAEAEATGRGPGLDAPIDAPPPQPRSTASEHVPAAPATMRAALRKGNRTKNRPFGNSRKGARACAG